MKILTEKVKAKELQPGELFSNVGSEYWDHRILLSIGEKVYIRTEAPCPIEEKEYFVFKIKIV